MPVGGSTAARLSGFCPNARMCSILSPSLSPFSLSLSHALLRPAAHTPPCAVVPLTLATAVIVATLSSPISFSSPHFFSSFPLFPPFESARPPHAQPWLYPLSPGRCLHLGKTAVAPLSLSLSLSLTHIHSLNPRIWDFANWGFWIEIGASIVQLIPCGCLLMLNSCTIVGIL